MAEISDVRMRVRRALGDLGSRFRETLPSSGTEYDLGHTRIGELEVAIVANSEVTPVPSSDYTLDASHGLLTLNEEPPENSQVLVTGTYYGLFEDSEIDDYIDLAVARHTYDREITTRYREEGTGFIRYARTPITLENLPQIEEEALVILATIEALWDMATDAASDVDVWTAEGTHLARGQRFDQLTQQIQMLKARYDEMCNQLNIGLNRIQVSTLRRESKQTGRLVPVFRPREYDEAGPGSYPKRILPPIERAHEDESGLPSPIWGPW